MGGVSPQIVRKWCRMGMPHTRAEENGSGKFVGIRILPGPALEWLAKNRTKEDWAGRGGNRGGGRPRKGEEKKRAFTTEHTEGTEEDRQRRHGDGFEAEGSKAGEIAEQGSRIGFKASGEENAEQGRGNGFTPETPNPKPETRDPEPGTPQGRNPTQQPDEEHDARLFDPDAPLDAATLLRLSGITLQKLRLSEEILCKRTERLQIEGQLIDAEEVERTWTRTLTSFRRQLNLSVRRMADLAAALCGGADFTAEAPPGGRAQRRKRQSPMANRQSGRPETPNPKPQTRDPEPGGPLLARLVSAFEEEADELMARLATGRLEEVEEEEEDVSTTAEQAGAETEA